MREERTYTTEQELVADGWEIIGREDWKPGVVRLSSRKLSTVPALFRMDYVDAPVRDAAERFPAHYCAMDHIKVWHNDEVPGQPEELSCPVCFERARVAGLEAELACEKAAHLVTAREFEFQRERAAGLERERDSYRNEHRILEAKYGKVCDDRDAARALLADARETIGWIMSSREGAALFGIDVDRALKAEAEIAAGNTVSWEELRLELTAKARALAQPRAERETKE